MLYLALKTHQQFLKIPFAVDERHDGFADFESVSRIHVDASH